MAYFQARRDFLKLATTGASATVVIPGSLGALGDVALRGEDKFIRSICEMCSSRCPMEARVVNGKTVLIQGNAFAKEMGTSLCAKGVAGASQLYDSQRLVKPLIRTGKRGENKWREASWDEALSLISTKLSALKERYGARSVIFSAKTGEQYDLLRSFASAFGSPNFENSTYILNFGHNLFEGLDIPLTKAMAHFSADPSKKLVVFDPRFSVMASKANEWHPIKAGSDLAFVLALLHVWIRDGKFDKKFIEQYTLGFDKLVESVKETTPQWQQSLTGIDAKVVERIAAEIYTSAPRCIIDWGHKATTTKAEFQRTRAILMANILMGNVEKEGGIYFAKTAERINALADERVAPELNDPYPRPRVNEPRIDGAGEEGMYRFVSRSHGVLQAIPDAILAQKPYEIKGWFLTRHNPLVTVAHPQKMKEAMEQLEFIVVNDVYLSDTAMMADVVLPEATYLERDEGISKSAFKTPTYMMRNRIVAPMHHTKSLIEVMRDLAERMGFGSHYAWKSIAELRAFQAKGDAELLQTLLMRGVASFDVPPLLALQPSSVERFCERYPKSSVLRDTQGVFSHFLRSLKTPSKKIEIFSAEVEKTFKGYGVPRSVDMDVTQGHPYVLTSGKSAVHTNGHTQNIPYLNMLLSTNPIWMHPSTAKAHGLKMGDTFYLQNAISKEKATVFITEGIRPDTLFAYMGFGRDAPQLKRTHGKGTNPSKLLSLESATLCGAMITNVGVTIVKA
ncbi:MAG: polysulfide reductase-like protein, subunit [Proteobacteria bacterium]|nr:polysulfide reductase-like protein, subunit [Pseudomonadota bacterium]